MSFRFTSGDPTHPRLAMSQIIRICFASKLLANTFEPLPCSCTPQLSVDYRLDISQQRSKEFHHGNKAQKLLE